MDHLHQSISPSRDSAGCRKYRTMYIHWRDLRIVYSPVDTESPPVSTWRRYSASSHHPWSRNTTRLEYTVVGRSKTRPDRRVEHRHGATIERRGVVTCPVPTTIPLTNTSQVVPRSTPNVAGMLHYHTPPHPRDHHRYSLRLVVVVMVPRWRVRPSSVVTPSSLGCSHSRPPVPP